MKWEQVNDLIFPVTPIMNHIIPYLIESDFQSKYSSGVFPLHFKYGFHESERKYYELEQSLKILFELQIWINSWKYAKWEWWNIPHLSSQTSNQYYCVHSVSIIALLLHTTTQISPMISCI